MKDILFTIVLTLLLELGKFEKLERSFIEKIEEEALKLSVEDDSFAEDSRLIQVVDEAKHVTIYKHLSTEKKGSPVFRIKGSHSGKEVVVLTREQDRLQLKPSLEKRIFVVLKKNPAEHKHFFVFYAYLRNAFAKETDNVVEIGGQKYRIEWDVWDHRGSSNLAGLFGWTTCSRSIFISCKKEATPPSSSTNSKSIKLLEPESDTEDYSAEEDAAEGEAAAAEGRALRRKPEKVDKPSPLRNFYPTMDYQESQTGFFVKTIRQATLAEAILIAIRPSLTRLIKKYAIDVELLEQVGTTRTNDDDDDEPVATGKTLRRPRTVLNKFLAKALNVFTEAFPDIGALSQGHLFATVNDTAEMYLKGSEVMEQVLTSATLKGDRVERRNPNPVILLHNEITLVLTGKAGPLAVLTELAGGSAASEPPLAKLIDVKATNSLIENILPSFSNATTNKIKEPKKAPKKDKVKSLLDALRPNGFAKFQAFRLKRQEPPVAAAPDAKEQQMAALRALLVARAKAMQEDAQKKAAENNLPDVTLITTPPPLAVSQDAQSEQLAKLKALLAARVKAQQDAAADQSKVLSPAAASGDAVGGDVQTEKAVTDDETDAEKQKSYKELGEKAGSVAFGFMSEVAKGSKKSKSTKKGGRVEDEEGASESQGKGKHKGGSKKNGIFGNMMGSFFGRKKRTEIRDTEDGTEDQEPEEEVSEDANLEKPSKVAGGVVETRQDVFSSLGWMTQQDWNQHLLNSGTFSGWGLCKTSDDVTLLEINKAKSVDKLAELLMDLMKTRCDSRVRDRVDQLITDKYIDMTDNKTIVFGTKALQLLRKAKLGVEETEKLSLSFELAVFSQAVVTDLKRFGNVSRGPVKAHADMSKSAFVLMHFALTAVTVARAQCGAHYVLLTRNTALTVQSAVARLLTDVVKMSYQPVLKQKKVTKALRQRSFNNFFNLVGVLDFYVRGSEDIAHGTDAVDQFKTFMEHNSKRVLKTTENFTSKIKGVTSKSQDV